MENLLKKPKEKPQRKPEKELQRKPKKKPEKKYHKKPKENDLLKTLPLDLEQSRARVEPPLLPRESFLLHSTGQWKSLGLPVTVRWFPGRGLWRVVPQEQPPGQLTKSRRDCHGLQRVSKQVPSPHPDRRQRRTPLQRRHHPAQPSSSPQVPVTSLHLCQRRQQKIRG